MMMLIVKQLLILVLTKVLILAVGYLTRVLQVVEDGALEGDLTPDATKRALALTKLQDYAPKVPEFIHRAAIEVGVLALKVGITTERFKSALIFVFAVEPTDRTSDDKRAEVLFRLKEMYPDIDETAARILLELAVGQMKAEGKEV